MTRYSIEPRTRKHVKRFLFFVRRLSDIYEKNLLDTATKTRLDAKRAASKKVVHKISSSNGRIDRRNNH